MFLTQPLHNQPTNSLPLPLPPHCTFFQQIPQNLSFQNPLLSFSPLPSFNPQINQPNPFIIIPACQQYPQYPQGQLVPVIIGPFPVEKPQAEVIEDEKINTSEMESRAIETLETQASPRMAENIEQEATENEKRSVENPSKKIRKINKKVYREKYSAKAEKILKNWVMSNFYDLYPMPDEKVHLAKECGISINQVNSWFKNIRQLQSEIPCKFACDVEKALLNAH